MPESCSGHLDAIFKFQNRKRVVKNIVSFLKQHNKIHPFDVIVCRGLSGIVPASIAAHYLNKGLCCIRHDMTNHSAGLIEGQHPTGRYIILDDFIASGNTINTILDTLYDNLNMRESTCQGIVLYERLGGNITKWDWNHPGCNVKLTFPLYRLPEGSATA